MSDLTLQIVILGIPGILCYFITSKLIGKIGKNNLEEFLSIFLFSILSYFIYSLILSAINVLPWINLTNEVLVNIFSSKPNMREEDLIGSAFAAILLSFIISYLYNYNILNKFARAIKSTNRYGDEDVWHYLFTNELKAINWFVVRDLKNNLMYLGEISTYSETEKDRELLIKNADVYRNTTGELLYSVSSVYICLAKNDITIEANPKLEENKNEKNN